MKASNIFFLLIIILGFNIAITSIFDFNIRNSTYFLLFELTIVFLTVSISEYYDGGWKKLYRFNLGDICKAKISGKKVIVLERKKNKLDNLYRVEFANHETRLWAYEFELEHWGDGYAKNVIKKNRKRKSQ